MPRLIRIADWSGEKRGNAVFFHGLGGHPYDSWRRSADDASFWPLWLAEDVEGLSVFSYGYHSPPTNWLGTAMPLLDEADHALRLLLASEELKSGPIFLICHSLGGLIAKAIIRTANEQSADPACASLLERMRLVVFIATPHTGSDKATLMQKLAWLAWPSASSRNLAANSPELRHLSFSYRSIAEERAASLSHLVYFEMKDTLLGGIVAPAAADPGLPKVRPAPIPDDHIGIAKPQRRGDLVYDETRRSILDLDPACVAPGELRIHQREPFDRSFSWSHVLPMGVRAAALALLALGVWQGVPWLRAEWQAHKEGQKTSKKTLEELRELTETVTKRLAGQASSPPDSEALARASQSIEHAIRILSEARDEQSRQAFEALKKGETRQAEALFAQILEERTKAGAAANSEAAEAARNIAAFSRLTDAAKAFGLYERASRLDPENPQNWINLGDTALVTGQTVVAREAFAKALDLNLRNAAAEPANLSRQRNVSLAYDRLGDTLAERGDRPAALEAYRNTLATAERLVAEEPGNATWQRDLSISHNKIGDILAEEGDRLAALEAYRKALAIRERLAERDPSNTAWQRDLSVSHSKIGDILAEKGDRPAALEAYRKTLAIAELLAARDSSNAAWQRDLSVSHNKIGDMLASQGDRLAALEAYRKDLAIAERLALKDTGNAAWQRDLSLSHSKIGDILLAQGNWPAALETYMKALSISERLAARDSGNAKWQRDLSISYNNIGDTLSEQGDRPAALEAYRKALAISERLAARDSSNTNWQRDLSVSHSKIGEILAEEGDRPVALEAYRKAFAIAERLALKDPGNTIWLRDLSLSHSKIGEILAEEGDRPAALEAYRKALAIAERLALKDPGNAIWQHDLALSHGRIGSTLKAVGGNQEAKRHLTQGRDIILRLIKLSPDYTPLRRNLALLEYELKSLN